MSATDAEYMQRALRLAARGLYTTEPNPRVGCVLVNDGDIVGEGWHRKAGEAHAEIHALRQAGERARGATAFVTLEPCCHTGKTAPCSQALIDAGVHRVVAAMIDPNPLVAGNGLAQLQAHGIATETGLLEAQARALNPGFVQRMEQGRPFVRLKLAMSLDARTAMASGESRWITGEAARRDVQRLRARSSAIVTGIGTVLQDDPRLDMRLDAAELGAHAAVQAPLNQPLRVVLDSQGRMPESAAMLQTQGRVLHVTAEGVVSQPAAAGGAEHWPLPQQKGGIDLHRLMSRLADRQVNECHVECGARLAGSFLQQGLVDELVVYLAPHIMGDAARGLFHLPGIERMAQRIALRLTDCRRVGEDLRLSYEVES